MKRNVDNDLYKMYEEEFYKVEKLNRTLNQLKLEFNSVNKENKYLKNKLENKFNKEITKMTKPLIEENIKLKEELNNAFKEIERLKTELVSRKEDNDKNYKIDKLTNQVHKNSTNSSIPTSKEISKAKTKTGANTYNHREKTNRNTGGQLNHKGVTLTKEQLEQKINEKHLRVVEIKHYVKGKSKKGENVKYKVCICMEPVIEKHIFIYGKQNKEEMSSDFYSDVTYDESVQAMVVMLGYYYSLSYNKIQEFLSDFTNGIVNLSQGTIDNIYKNFSSKTTETLNNITTNILNGKYTHTDETVTSENGKESYYRGYGNPSNILYKYHHSKGDEPIKEDNILNQFYGTIISDHEVGIFKYGTNHQECAIHIGRYCEEETQNVYEIWWPDQIAHLLFRIEKNRKILSKFGKEEFTEEEIQQIEQEYDDILNEGLKENQEIFSTYWKEKANALLRRLKKYKNYVLFFIHDFSIPYDNNFMERALRMIKGKTKVSGGFRSTEGAIRFGNTMSIIKTARLRKVNVLECIKLILEGKSLFA